MNDATPIELDSRQGALQRSDSLPPSQVQKRKDGSVPVERTQRIVIASTFAADLLRDPLKFWMEAIDLASEIVLAPYAQLLQELLNPESVLSHNRGGFNILLVRLEDWIRDRRADSVEQNLQHIDRVANDFARAVAVSRTRTGAQTLVFFCPFSSSLPEPYAPSLAEIQVRLISRLETLANMHCWSHADLARLYPVSEYEDARADKIGHIPYTNEYFAALATLLTRRIAALVKPRYKVIAVDCDNTLWKGVCGEDGATGVELTPAHLEFQKMLVRQHDAGVLLCLCSKNNEGDVEAVFKARPEMPLREEHLICSRVNWNSKSSNLRSLSRELNLSLDSFILIDDSPLECAEVQTNCPSVLALRLPQRADEIRYFLDHVWAFDHVTVTEEGKQRTAQYKQNRARDKAIAEATDLEQFLATLELKVEVSSMQPRHLDRVAELIQRTNQFNLTSIRRSVSDIEALWSAGELQCLVIHVRDRFGDYGLVGALFFRCLPLSIDVDTFVLSCRVLGRGVEHRIINELGRAAREREIANVTLRYRKTLRSAPAWAFLQKSCGRFQQESSSEGDAAERVFIIPTDFAENLGHTPVAVGVEATERKSTAASSASEPSSTRWLHAAYRLSRIPDLIQEMNRASRTVRAERGKNLAPRTATETAIAEIWAKVLRVSRVGIRDDFFEIGGDSVRAVQVIAEIGSAFGSDLSVYDFFKGPTVAEVAAKLGGASADAQHDVLQDVASPGYESMTPEMLTQLELDEQQFARIVATVSGGAKNLQDVYPLSPLQEGMLFHHLMNEQNDTYVLSILIELQSHAHAGALVNALQKVIDRHDILRSAILWENVTRPVQVVYRQANLPVEELALDANRDSIEQLKEWTKPERQRMDLRKAPLLTLQVAADPNSNRGYAVLKAHHIICDHQSLRILFAEVMMCLQGRERELSKPAVYRDHVTTAIARSQTQDAEGFFRGKLGDIDEPTAPFGLFDVYGEGSQMGETRRMLNASLAQQLRTQARRLGVSAARLFHAAWGLFVARTSGRNDVIYGTVVSGVQQGSAQELSSIGMFVNTLPLRLRIQDTTVEELVKQTHRELVELLEYGQVSLTVARRCSGLTGNVPLFTSLLNYRYSLSDDENAPESAAGIRVIDRGGPWTSYPVTLTVDDFGEDFRLTVKTDGRIDSARVSGYVQTTVESLVNALERTPQTLALALSILPEKERRQVVESFNATSADHARHKLIHELFEEQVSQTPEAVAVVYEGQSLTYAELNVRANQLAHYLRHKRVGPDQLVAVYLARGVEMLVGLLGVLKAGGAYIPLDPNNPAERLEHLLTDAEPRVVLTQERLRNTLPRTSAEAITLDGEWEEIAKQNDANLDAASLQLNPRHLAYVIYTSGSTGRPKGVMIEHRNLVNYAVHALRQFDVASGDGSLICTSISFDLMLTGLYPTLLCGRTVRLCREEHGVPAVADEILQTSNLAPLKLTPSHLALLEDPLRKGQLAGRVRVLVCGGESLHGSAVRLWRTHAPGTRIFNHYGPTETTVGCVVGEVGEHVSDAVPIGRPISNTRVYILDDHRQPAPIGVAGEIYIGGAGVARGYLNQPELTAERFLPDPFGADPRARMYRTGDLGRWRPDGTIEYLGRNDHQVKVRGFRIELGEIEAHLRRHEQVKGAVVIAREDAPGDKRLVAYVTQRDQCDVSVEHLRTHLKTALPEYMVPSAFVVLESLPLTPNGKLDRSALPVPNVAAHASRLFEAPQGEAEETLAGIWRELLRVDRVGRSDDFFDLGGHSLLATRVISRIRELFRVELPLKALFEAPTVAQLAVRVEAAGNRRSAEEALWMGNLARDLRKEISEMDDEAVSAQIAELEKQLAHSGGGLSPSDSAQLGALPGVSW